MPFAEGPLLSVDGFPRFVGQGGVAWMLGVPHAAIHDER